jgi:hypothetical protein
MRSLDEPAAEADTDTERVWRETDPVPKTGTKLRPRIRITSGFEAISD